MALKLMLVLVWVLQELATLLLVLQEHYCCWYGKQIQLMLELAIPQILDFLQFLCALHLSFASVPFQFLHPKKLSLEVAGPIP